MISFIWPAMLGLLLLLPLFVVLYRRALTQRQQLLQRQRSLWLTQGASGQAPGVRRHLPPLLSLLALTLLTLALARPVAAIDLPRLEGTVMLTFDVSGSMAATDLEPTRMAAAQAAAVAFVERQPSTVQIGVVAFSDGGLTVQLPTNDRAAILAAIERLRPERGTSLGAGMLAALNAIALDAGTDTPISAPEADATIPPTETYPSSVIVLLSDGENTARPDPLEVAQAAAERGVRIYAVGVGTTAGATLELDGFSVHSRLEEAPLQQIAQLTEGGYYPAEEREQLERIYDEVGAQLVVKPEQTEVTALFVGVSLVLLLAGGLCSLLWFGRMP